MRLVHTGVIVALTSACASSSSSFQVGEVQVHTLRLNYNNAHLVEHDGALILIDGGLQGDADDLEANIRDAGFDPAALQAVIITHGHADHAGGARHFKDKYGTQVVAGAGDRGMLLTGRNEKLCPTDSTGEDRLEQDQNATYEPFEADIWIDGETDLATITKMSGRVIALPGHTQGSLVVLVGDVALVGDLFRGAIVGSSAVTHFYMCDLDDNGRDIRHLLDTLAPNARLFFVGHFGPVERDEVEALAPGAGAAIIAEHR